jgi:hypothetical protein
MTEAKNLSLPGGHAGPVPNLEGFGLKWRALQRLIDKQADLFNEGRELGFEPNQAEAPASLPGAVRVLGSPRHKAVPGPRNQTSWEAVTPREHATAFE